MEDVGRKIQPAESCEVGPCAAERRALSLRPVTTLITAISGEYGGTAVTSKEFANGVVRPILEELTVLDSRELLATCGTTLLRDLVTDVRLREQAAEYLRRPE